MKAILYAALIAALFMILTNEMQSQIIQNQISQTMQYNDNSNSERILSLYENLILDKNHMFHDIEIFQHLIKGRENQVSQLKSSMEDIQKPNIILIEYWDSTNNIWKRQAKEVYNYDSNGNLSLYHGYNWDENTFQWLDSERKEYTHDTLGNTTSSSHYFWEMSTSHWVGNTKDEYTYDANGNDTLLLSYRWNGLTEQWYPDYKMEYTYDTNHNLISDVLFFSTDLISSWAKISKKDHFFDVNGKDTLLVDYDWDVYINQWSVAGKEELTYDADGNDSLWLYYYWNDSTSKWDRDAKYEFTYDANGHKTLFIMSFWSDSTSQWTFLIKEEFGFDSRGNNTTYAYYYWEVSESRWIGNKTEYTYNANDKLLTGIDYGWDDMKNDWTEIYKYEITYDETGILPLYMIDYDKSSDSLWILIHRWTYFYSEQNPTYVPETNDRLISVYPNPAKEYIEFDLTDASAFVTVELFDLQGRLVIQNELPADKKIVVSYLPKGLYLYRVHDNGNIYRGKIVVE